MTSGSIPTHSRCPRDTGNRTAALSQVRNADDHRGQSGAGQVRVLALLAYRTGHSALGRVSVFEPTGRANARPMTGSVGTGSREENASKQKIRAPFRFNRTGAPAAQLPWFACLPVHRVTTDIATRARPLSRAHAKRAAAATVPEVRDVHDCDFETRGPTDFRMSALRARGDARSRGEVEAEVALVSGGVRSRRLRNETGLSA